MQTHPTLYKIASKGAIQQWFVEVTDNTVTINFGQVDGKMQKKSTVCTPKNVGKTNETTGHEQALREASSKYERQLKKGYVTDTSGKSDIKLPMKVKSYFSGDNKYKILFPAYVSKKLNGVNGEIRLLGDDLVLQLSRGGLAIPLPRKEAIEELKQVMKLLNVTSLNYEIYCHGEYLQDINGAVKAPKNHAELHSKLEYHIFDLPSLEGVKWEDRYKKLLEIPKNLTYVKAVDVLKVNNHDDVIAFQDKAVAAGYEGSIVRNSKGLYEYNKRTEDVQKVKYVLSDEFKISGFTIDKNQHPVFVCDVDGKSFSVKIKGTDEYRKSVVAEVNDWIDKWLTIEYETLSKDGIPLKPVGISLRQGVEDPEGNFTPTL